MQMQRSVFSMMALKSRGFSSISFFNRLVSNKSMVFLFFTSDMEMELFGWKKMRRGAGAGPRTGNGLKVIGSAKITQPTVNENAFCRHLLHGHENQVFAHPSFAHAFGRPVYACTIWPLCVPFQGLPTHKRPGGRNAPGPGTGNAAGLGAVGEGFPVRTIR
jgi:hypothetical protein